MTTTEKPSLVEVWLTQRNMQVIGREIREDESGREIDVASTSMRGAQREITTYYIDWGYRPEGRWSIEAEDDEGATETWRRFKLAR
jgi:hypothetical protein